MQRLFVFTFSLFFLVSLFACQDKSASHKQSDSKDSVTKSAPAQVYFDGDCSQAVVKELEAAKSNIFVEAHAFVPASVVQALVEAHKRNVGVEVITGKAHRKAKYSSASALDNAGIPVYVDKQATAGRNQTILIDGKTVITGSLDCGKLMDARDAENLTIIKSPELARVYVGVWAKRKQYSKPYRTKPGAAHKAAPKRKP